MAVPRHKTSKMRSRTRRSHDALSPAARSLCPRCNADKTPHCVCDNCGFYRGEEKVKID